MPETWVLFVLYWSATSSYEHSSMVSQEFLSKATCEAAKASVKKEFDGYASKFVSTRKVYAVCVEK